MMRRLLLFAFWGIALVPLLNGQQTTQVAFIPTQHAWANRLLSDIDSLGHTQVLPLNPFTYGTHRLAVAEATEWEAPLGQDGWLMNAIFNRDALHLNRKNFSLVAHPTFDITLGQDNSRAEAVYQNTRGLALQGRIGQNVAFYTDFHENQARFPTYLEGWIDNSIERPKRVVPGQGIPKTFKSDPTQYDYAYATGMVSWQMNKFFNAQFGNGKNFIGEGHRSLLLSDNAFNYPYFRLQTRFWKVQYTNLYAQLRDVNFTLSDGTYARKYIASHYLSVNLGKKINIGLFETVIYGDSLGTRRQELAYLNPIIFYRPVEFAIGSRGGNVLMGLQASYRASAQLHFYGQLALDEFKIDELRANDGWWANKYGYQVGVKGRLAQPNVYYRLEFNTVRPYTYGHTVGLQNYAQYNQALAHPLGANFQELVLQVNYYRGRWFAEAQLNYQQVGRDETGQHWGSDVYISNRDREQERGNETLQGTLTQTIWGQVRLGWTINPAYNLRLETGLQIRQFS
ncbi:MAG: hypothetical protein AAGJ82_12295, partial [Bacteroidota bacterium]